MALAMTTPNTPSNWLCWPTRDADLPAREADKIKGAIRTDFVLSAEIVVIALGTVADQSFSTQVAVLSGIGLIMTVGVYGVVAGIVKMDDIGLHLLTKSGALARTIGKACCWRRRA
jgi:predicted DNA repair protein MutK